MQMQTKLILPIKNDDDIYQETLCAEKLNNKAVCDANELIDTVLHMCRIQKKKIKNVNKSLFKTIIDFKSER